MTAGMAARACCLALTCCLASPSTLRVAAFVSRTGVLSPFGVWQSQALSLFMTAAAPAPQLNLTILDDASNLTVALLATQAALDDGFRVFVAPLGSAAAVPVAALLAAQPFETLLIAPAMSRTNAFVPFSSAFSMLPPSLLVFDTPLYALVAAGARSILRTAVTGVYGNDACAHVPFRLPLEDVTPPIIYNFDAATFASVTDAIVDAIAALRPDVVLMCGFERDAISIVTRARSRGINAAAWVAFNMLDAASLAQQTAPLSDTFLIDATPWVPVTKFAVQLPEASCSMLVDGDVFNGTAGSSCTTPSELNAAYIAAFGSTPPSYLAAASHASLDVLSQAYRVAGNASSTGALTAILRSRTFDTALGTVIFGPTTRQNTAELYARQSKPSMMLGGAAKVRVIAPLLRSTGKLVFPAPTWQYIACVRYTECGAHGVCAPNGACTCTLGYSGRNCQVAWANAAAAPIALVGFVAAVACMLYLKRSWRARQRADQEKELATTHAAELRAATAAQVRTTAYAIHELANPLFTAVATVEELEHAASGAGAADVSSMRDAVARLRQALQHMQRVVAVMLAYSFPSSPLTVTVNRVALEDVLRDVQNRMQRLHDVHVVIDVRGTLPASMCVDSAALYRMLVYACGTVHAAANPQQECSMKRAQRTRHESLHDVCLQVQLLMRHRNAAAAVVTHSATDGDGGTTAAATASAGAQAPAGAARTPINGRIRSSNLMSPRANAWPTRSHALIADVLTPDSWLPGAATPTQEGTNTELGMDGTCARLDELLEASARASSANASGSEPAASSVCGSGMNSSPPWPRVGSRTDHSSTCIATTTGAPTSRAVHTHAQDACRVDAQLTITATARAAPNGVPLIRIPSEVHEVSSRQSLAASPTRMRHVPAAHAAAGFGQSFAAATSSPSLHSEQSPLRGMHPADISTVSFSQVATSASPVLSAGRITSSLQTRQSAVAAQRGSMQGGHSSLLPFAIPLTHDDIGELASACRATVTQRLTDAVPAIKFQLSVCVRPHDTSSLGYHDADALIDMGGTPGLASAYVMPLPRREGRRTPSPSLHFERIWTGDDAHFAATEPPRQIATGRTASPVFAIEPHHVHLRIDEDFSDTLGVIANAGTRVRQQEQSSNWSNAGRVSSERGVNTDGTACENGTPNAPTGSSLHRPPSVSRSVGAASALDMLLDAPIVGGGGSARDVTDEDEREASEASLHASATAGTLTDGFGSTAGAAGAFTSVALGVHAGSPPPSSSSGSAAVSCASSFAAARPVSSALQMLRILVVEDEVVNAQLVARMLKRLGHHAVVVYDGLDIPFLAEEGTPIHFDVILLDIVMRRSHGVDIAERVFAAGYGGYLVAMTANTGASDRATYAAVGFHAVLGKPFAANDMTHVCTQARLWLAERIQGDTNGQHESMQQVQTRMA